MPYYLFSCCNFRWKVHVFSNDSRTKLFPLLPPLCISSFLSRSLPPPPIVVLASQPDGGSCTGSSRAPSMSPAPGVIQENAAFTSDLYVCWKSAKTSPRTHSCKGSTSQRSAPPEVPSWGCRVAPNSEWKGGQSLSSLARTFGNNVNVIAHTGQAFPPGRATAQRTRFYLLCGEAATHGRRAEKAPGLCVSHLLPKSMREGCT